MPCVREVERTKSPLLKSAALPWLGAGASVLLLTALYVLACYGYAGEFAIPFFVLPTAMTGVILFAGLVSHARQRATRSLERKLQEASTEVSLLAEEQRSFLSRLDDRMVKYFNSNTLSDSYTLFILMQLRDLVESRHSKIALLLSDPSARHLLIAYALIAKPLSVRESVLAGVGRISKLPLSSVRATMGPLLDHLQESLLALEAERGEQLESVRQSAIDNAPVLPRGRIMSR